MQQNVRGWSWLLIVSYNKFWILCNIEFIWYNRIIGWSFEADVYVIFIEFNQFLWILLSQLHIAHHLEACIHKVNFELQHAFLFLYKQNVQYFFQRFFLCRRWSICVLVDLNIDLLITCIMFFDFVRKLIPCFPIFFVFYHQWEIFCHVIV
jgi:hypothetical protein